MVSNFAPPKVIGEINYVGAAEAMRECTDFREVLEQRKRDGKSGFVEAFLTAPSPGIVVAAIRNEHYDTEDAYLAAVGRALQVEYEAIADQGFLLQLDCPDLALEHHISFQDRPLGDFLGFVERVVATINDALAQHSARKGAHARLLGKLRGTARPRRGAGDDPAADRAHECRRAGVAVCQSPPRP